MLSQLSRWLTYGVVAAFGLLGTVLYLAPRFSAARLPWSVSAFLAMTMGAWYVGTAFFAWRAVRDWRWPVVHPLLIYVWAFSLGQALVLAIHADDLSMGRGLAWPYVLAVVGAAAVALVGIADAVRSRLSFGREGPPVPLVLRVGGAAFVVAVFLLALPLVDGYDRPRSIWPGTLTLISARSFAVFFTALAVSSIAVAAARGLGPVVAYARAGIPLTVLILAAAVVYRSRFDFGDHSGQFLYVGLYVLVAVLALAVIAYAERTTARPEAGPG